MFKFMPFGISKCLPSVALAAMLFFSLPVYSQVKKAAASGQFRTITVTTQPNAVVWLNGVRFGRCGSDGKLTIKTVAAGAQMIRIRADGFKDKTHPLTAAQNGEIKVDLVRTEDQAELMFQEAERLAGSDREKAAAAYRNAISKRANYPEAYLALARILSDSGDLEAAQKAIVSAKKLRPGYAEASAVEGRIQKESGEEDRAIAAFKRALAEGKGFQPEALTGLGILYKEKAEAAGSGDIEGETENYTESARYLKLALKQLSGAPDAIVIYQLLGLIYEKQKRTADAIALYEEFLRLFPESVEATAVRSFIVQLKKQ